MTLIALREALPHDAQVSADVAPTTCAPTPDGSFPVVGVDLAASVRYDLGRMAEGNSKSVRVRYQVY